jgi:hypothetical protein
MDFIKGELEKEFNAVGFRSQRRHLKTLPQTQKKGVDKERDKERKALMPGKRMSKNGKIYWESRMNRSDSKSSKL